jgi:nuclear pore complex protein Nup62
MNKQLDDLSRNLTEMIKDVNQISSSSQSHAPRPSSPSGGEINQAEDDPVTQLSAILGSHLRALNGIDGRSGKLENDLKELERRLAGGGTERNGGGFGRASGGSGGGGGGGYGLSRLG